MEDIIDIMLKKRTTSNMYIDPDKKKKYDQLKSEILIDKQPKAQMQYKCTLLIAPLSSYNYYCALLHSLQVIDIQTNKCKNIITLYDHNGVCNIITRNSHYQLSHLTSAFRTKSIIITPIEPNISNLLSYYAFDDGDDIVVYTVQKSEHQLLLSKHIYVYDEMQRKRVLGTYNEEYVSTAENMKVRIYNAQYNANITNHKIIYIDFYKHIFIVKHSKHIAIKGISNGNLMTLIRVPEAESAVDYSINRWGHTLFIIAQYADYRVCLYVGDEAYTIYTPPILKRNHTLKLISIASINAVLYETVDGSINCYSIPQMQTYFKIINKNGIGDKKQYIYQHSLRLMDSFDEIKRIY